MRQVKHVESLKNSPVMTVIVSEMQGKPSASTTGIVTFSFKGQQSFHVFALAFSAREGGARE